MSAILVRRSLAAAVLLLTPILHAQRTQKSEAHIRDDSRRQTVANQTKASTSWALKSSNEPLSVSRSTYQHAVTEFKHAFAAAEAARARLAVVQPDGGPPDPMDCYFHPWHKGCRDVLIGFVQSQDESWESAVRLQLQPSFQSDTQRRAVVNPWAAAGIAWVVGKTLNYVWDVGQCLYEADKPDGRGLEGSEGMKKFGNCFVKQGVASGGSWTTWLSRDNPGGSGDFETLQDFIKAGQVCTTPLAIECETTAGVSWNNAGQVYTCSVDKGGICANSDQGANGRCLDYRVRFLCP